MAKKKNDTDFTITLPKDKKPKRKRTDYSDEFKKKAVKLLITNDSNVSKTAKELGITRSMLINWRKDERFKVDEETAIEIKTGGSVSSVSTLDTPEVEAEIAQVVMDSIQKLGTIIPRISDPYKLTTIIKTMVEAQEKIKSPSEGEGSAKTITNYIQNIQNVYHENT